MAYAGDLKSPVLHRTCGFDPHPGHQYCGFVFRRLVAATYLLHSLRRARRAALSRTRHRLGILAERRCLPISFPPSQAIPGSRNDERFLRSAGRPGTERSNSSALFGAVEIRDSPQTLQCISLRLIGYNRTTERPLPMLKKYFNPSLLLASNGFANLGCRAGPP